MKSIARIDAARAGLIVARRRESTASARTAIRGIRKLLPQLAASALDQIREVDPEGAAAEIDGQFLSNVSALYDDEALDAAVDVGVTVRPPCPGVNYYAHADVATGTKSTGDQWGVAIGHNDGRLSILDALLVIRPPFSPESASAATAALCRSYGGLTRISADKFASGFSNEAFARAGLRLEAAERTTSEYHIDLAAKVNSGLVRLLDHPTLLRELRGLERRRGATRDIATHRRGAHDDVATVAAGALVRAAKPASPVIAFIGGGGGDWQRAYFR